MMEIQPKIQLKFRRFDRIVEILAWLALVALWIITVLNYRNSPNTIATHFNAAGDADGFGNKNQLFSLPAIGTVIFTVMTTLNFFPHLFNYTNQITAANAAIQYRTATNMLRYLKLMIAVIFLFITLATVGAAHEQKATLGNYSLPVCLVLLALPTLFFVIKALKNRNPAR